MTTAPTGIVGTANADVQELVEDRQRPFDRADVYGGASKMIERQIARGRQRAGLSDGRRGPRDQRPRRSRHRAPLLRVGDACADDLTVRGRRVSNMRFRPRATMLPSVDCTLWTTLEPCAQCIAFFVAGDPNHHVLDTFRERRPELTALAERLKLQDHTGEPLDDVLPRIWDDLL